MAFKMKGSNLYGSPLKQKTKEESKKAFSAELNKIHDEQDDAENRGDGLTENIAHTAGRKKLAEGKKLYAKKK